MLVAGGLTKYNVGGARLRPLPGDRRILGPGQVEDDASIRLGTGEVRTNAALLAAVRAANPGSATLYKPHPDMEARLRPGAIRAPEADAVLRGVDSAPLLPLVDEVWAMISTIGFEALLRRIPVTCFAPFYAGWG